MQQAYYVGNVFQCQLKCSLLRFVIKCIAYISSQADEQILTDIQLLRFTFVLVSRLKAFHNNLQKKELTLFVQLNLQKGFFQQTFLGRQYVQYVWPYDLRLTEQTTCYQPLQLTGRFVNTANGNCKHLTVKLHLFQQFIITEVV